jgi:lipopolysaccharide cholinephosphotransferase
MNKVKQQYINDYDQLFPDVRPLDLPDIQQGQAVMLRLLKIFDKACNDLGLSYWLCGGTLLGAVRHGGFIPWDDDADVFMPREHYNQFREKAPEVLPYDVFVQTDTPWIRLVDRFATKENQAGNDFVFIDIFPAARFPLGRKLLRKVWMMIPPYPLPGVPEDAPLAQRIKRRAIRWTAIFLRITKLEYVVRGLCGLGPRRYWSYDLAVTWRFYYRDDWIFPLRRIRFEDASFFVPADCHNVLKHQYDDYMKLPEESDRIQHGHRAFHITRSKDHPEMLEWAGYAEKKKTAATAYKKMIKA